LGRREYLKPLNVNELARILKAEGIHLSKQRGQCYLLDEAMLSALAKITTENTKSSVIEIGAGIGNWTRHLCRKGLKIYAIEVDRKVFSILEQRMGDFSGSRNCRVVPIHVDAMKFDFPGFFADKQGEEFTIAGNLPYNLSSAILFQWIDLFQQLTPLSPFEEAFFMVQKEVAERMIARPGEQGYGRLSIMLAWSARVRIERKVPRQCFFPVPGVDSAFVRIEFGQGERPSSEKKNMECLDYWFSLIVRTAFSGRRKQIKNTVGKLSLSETNEKGFTGWNDVFDAAGLSGSERPEQLTVVEFGKLAQLVQ
jgi:16S rRNA (adenine1518-N6/adenine1519-N6)-dimethyltransferase